MGAHDDGTSVTDPTGMVWGVEGLHLATNGLIPTRLAVNPTLTTAALAVRAAERLVG
jgi:choline dehydrogenase-like flavoprotein